MLTDAEGEVAVHRARSAVAGHFGSTHPAADRSLLPPVFRERRGVFVTWRVPPDGSLRGCIGYPLPVLPLGDAIARAAVSAAIDDPRFPPIGPTELGNLVAEVSVLDAPRLLSSAAAGRSVRPGRDGLIVETDRTSGLLLPQVASEQGWSAEEFLSATCEKAGLRRDAWKGPGVRIRTFTAEVFAEEVPAGRVVRLDTLEAPPVTATPERPGPRTARPRPPTS